jgi:hypothetical protein
MRVGLRRRWRIVAGRISPRVWHCPTAVGTFVVLEAGRECDMFCAYMDRFDRLTVHARIDLSGKIVDSSDRSTFSTTQHVFVIVTLRSPVRFR